MCKDKEKKMTEYFITGVFYPSLQLDLVDVNNDRTSTHHCIVRVDDRRSRRSIDEHSEKGGNGYVVYHLHDGAHLVQFSEEDHTNTDL